MTKFECFIHHRAHCLDDDTHTSIPCDPIMCPSPQPGSVSNAFPQALLRQPCTDAVQQELLICRIGVNWGERT